MTTLARNVVRCPRRQEPHFCAHREAVVLTCYGPRRVYNDQRHIPLCGNPGLCECKFMTDAEFADACNILGGGWRAD